MHYTTFKNVGRALFGLAALLILAGGILSFVCYGQYQEIPIVRDSVRSPDKVKITEMDDWLDFILVIAILTCASAVAVFSLNFYGMMQFAKARKACKENKIYEAKSKETRLQVLYGFVASWSFLLFVLEVFILIFSIYGINYDYPSDAEEVQEFVEGVDKDNAVYFYDLLLAGSSVSAAGHLITLGFSIYTAVQSVSLFEEKKPDEETTGKARFYRAKYF